jgi:uncharacterized protein
VLRQAVRELLSQSTMTLATTGSAGEPHAAAVYFASDESINLYFFSDPTSQHVLDIIRNETAAAAIYPECKGWLDIRGLQLRGEVKPVEPGKDWEKGWQLYTDKFPFVRGFQLVVARNRLYQFRANWLRWSDNSRGFGHKEEWQRLDLDRSDDNEGRWHKLKAVDSKYESSNG